MVRLTWLLCLMQTNEPIHAILVAMQVRDKWGFQMTARYEMYADLLARYTALDYKPQVIKDPSLK